MAYEFLVQVKEESREALAIQSVADQEHITREEAVQRIWDEAILLRTQRTPAQELGGAFSSPEDQEVVDAAMDFVRKNRANYDVIRDFGV